MDHTARKLKIPNLYLCLLLVLSIASFFAFVQISVELFALMVGLPALAFLLYQRFADDVGVVVRGNAGPDLDITDDVDYSDKYILKPETYFNEPERKAWKPYEDSEKARHSAYYDGLTDLPNRSFILEALKRLLDTAGSCEPAKFSVLCLNLNRFRVINESLGHSTGDRIIRQVAKRICESIGDGDIAAHLGGDEFVVILNDIDDPDTAARMADTLARRIAESIRFKVREVYTSVSIGITFGCRNYKRATDILRDADIAMYNAKDNRQQWMIFDRTMYTRAVERQQLETDLRYAIVCDELELFYQPIVRLEDASLCGFEALVRWNHPRRGLVWPSEFIPIAESTGLIVPMSTQILQRSCAQLGEWEKRFGRNSLMMSVNLSVISFADMALVDQINSIMGETGIKPSSLKLEITESAVMGNAESAIAMLNRIKATGVSLSIDDFGTGYSSLSYLHKLPLDYLKIDRSFVTGMADGSENEEIVRTIVALAKALRLSIIAEGIETRTQLYNLRELGCEFGQGYLFSRPLPVNQIDAILSDDNLWSEFIAADQFSAPLQPDGPIHLETTQ